MAYIAVCRNGNGKVFHPDAENCLWVSKYKYRTKKAAETSGSRHRCWLSGSYSRGTEIVKRDGRALKDMKWGD